MTFEANSIESAKPHQEGFFDCPPKSRLQLSMEWKKALIKALDEVAPRGIIPSQTPEVEKVFWEHMESPVASKYLRLHEALDKVRRLRLDAFQHDYSEQYPVALIDSLKQLNSDRVEAIATIRALEAQHSTLNPSNKLLKSVSIQYDALSMLNGFVNAAATAYAINHGCEASQFHYQAKDLFLGDYKINSISALDILDRMCAFKVCHILHEINGHSIDLIPKRTKANELLNEMYSIKHDTEFKEVKGCLCIPTRAYADGRHDEYSYSTMQSLCRQAKALNGVLVDCGFAESNWQQLHISDRISPRDTKTLDLGVFSLKLYKSRVDFLVPAQAMEKVFLYLAKYGKKPNQ